MAQQKQAIDDTAEMLKAKAQQKEVVVGLETVVKGLRQGTIEKVFIASNSPPKMAQDLAHYAALAQVPLQRLAQNNEELGIICKKNFMVSVVGLRR